MKSSTVLRAAIAVVAALDLSACNMLNRLSEIGDEPKITDIQNPTTQPTYQPVTMPMPAPVIAERQPSSLWRPGARAFLKDQRANNVGDVVTVVINVNESAQISNETKSARTSAETAQATNFLGIESELNKVLPDAVNPASLVNTGSTSANDGNGSVNRSEQVTLSVAATITQVLPNGNLVVQGRQEMRINYEVRDLQVAGVIRPQDISAINTIPFDQIAEARLSYAGHGQISDKQQPRYGEQIFDVLFPF